MPTRRSNHPDMNSCSITILSSLLLILCFLVHDTIQLECYVCQNQEDNKSKCSETVKICDVEQEKCLTEVRWGSTPYWALTGQKQYFISKRCATKVECQEAMADKQHKCDRIWYNDWTCTDCCSGDKCNYYATLGSYSIQPMNPIIMISFAAIAIYHITSSSIRQHY